MAVFEKRDRAGRRATGEDVGVSAHGAADEDGLADQLVVDRNQGVVGRERASAALAVHQQLLRHTIHHVLLHLPRTAQSFPRAMRHPAADHNSAFCSLTVHVVACPATRKLHTASEAWSLVNAWQALY